MSFSPAPASAAVPHYTPAADEPRGKKRGRKGGGQQGPTPAQALMRDIGQACKKNDIAKGLAAYRSAREAGTRIAPSVFSTLIALCSGLSNHIKPAAAAGGGGGAEDDGEGDAMETEAEDGAPADEAPAVAGEGAAAAAVVSAVGSQWHEAAFELYRDAVASTPKMQLQEAAYTSLLRICASTGDVTEARRLLDELKLTGQEVRLRTYLPLLEAHASAGDCEKAFGVYAEVKAAGLMVGEREYVQLLEAATGAQDAARAGEVLEALAEDVLRPSKAQTWPALRRWFESPAAGADGGGPWVVLSGGAVGASGAVGAGGGEGPAASSVAASVVDPASGLCRLTGSQLRSVDLSAAAGAKMMGQVEALALTMVRGDKEQGQKRWRDFTGWLGRRRAKGECFDTLIDGANVGFYKQNFAGAGKTVAFDQIDAVLRHFQRAGRKPLIFLHQRHTYVQNLPREFVGLVQGWRDERVLYTTPNGSNDDWYWLYAALFINHEASFGTASAIAAAAAGGAAGGAGVAEEALVSSHLAGPPAESPAPPPFAVVEGEAALPPAVAAAAPLHLLVVTNDEMRDHHFRMPSASVSAGDVQAFVRWKERHCCTFDLWGWDKQRRTKRVALFPPNPFSVRMQATPAPQAADVGAAGGSGPGSWTKALVQTWHVPSLAAASWGEGAKEVSFTDHAYSHAGDFAATSKPVDPDQFEWLVITRASRAAPPATGRL